MKPHEQRVVDERNELKVKLTKLNDFRKTDTYNQLPGMDQALLDDQSAIMGEYIDILDARIARFPKD
jgi:hypothetical protein